MEALETMRKMVTRGDEGLSVYIIKFLKRFIYFNKMKIKFDFLLEVEQIPLLKKTEESKSSTLTI